VVAAIFNVFAAHAEIVNNFGPLVDRKISTTASYSLLQGATLAMNAINSAEGGEPKKAAEQLQAAISTLEKARAQFREIQKIVGSTPIDMSKAGLPRPQLDQIARRYGIELPKTTDALTQLVIAEVDRFFNAMKEISFDGVQKARAGTLSYSSAISRLLDLGVLVSALADGGDIPKR